MIKALDDEELLIQYQETRNQDIRQQILDRYVPFLIKVCEQEYFKRDYWKYNFFTVGDFISFGFFGLNRAVEKYDPNWIPNTKFKNFAAYKIKKEIIEFLRRYFKKTKETNETSFMFNRDFLKLERYFSKDSNPEETASRKDTRDFLFRTLPKNEKNLMILYFYCGLNLRESAQAIGVTEGRACQLKQSALRQLREKLRVLENLVT